MLRQLLTTTVLVKIIALSVFATGPFPGQIKNLVTFGDSYTDVVSSHFLLSEHCRHKHSPSFVASPSTRITIQTAV